MPPGTSKPGRPVRAIPEPALILLAAAVGCVGGIYGIGGGSILAPILIGTGRPPAQAAPAALASTFVASVARRGDLHHLVDPHPRPGSPRPLEGLRGR
jgi:uncharacterized protein